jgi:hypothetical protein
MKNLSGQVINANFQCVTTVITNLMVLGKIIFFYRKDWSGTVGMRNVKKSMPNPMLGKWQVF